MSEPPGIYDLERMLKGSSYEAMLRASIIEECARVAENFKGKAKSFSLYRELLAAAIRALKDKP